MKNFENLFSEPISVLIVDDNIVDRKVLERLLLKTASNIKEIKTAKNFKSTIEFLESGGIDVVVLDLNLPDSKGAETLLKLTEKFPHIAVVVNTGAYEDDLGLKTMSMGAQDFIIKGKYKAYGLIKSINYAKERKRYELELQETYLKLTETQSQLAHAEKMNTIGRLASGVAHEVKNPLATILFGVAYLNEKISIDDEKIEITLKSISESAKRANNIIKDLLDFSSLSRLEKREENINDIVEKSLSLTKHSLNKNCVKAIHEFTDDLPAINVDRNRIEQVLVNLIINATHAMLDGGELRFKTFKRIVSKGDTKLIGSYSDGTEVVFLEVIDNGTGIPENKIKKIFDPFFTTKRSSGGVGLGLSVAKNIIEMHEGRIFIENNEDAGVTATLVFKKLGEE